MVSFVEVGSSALSVGKGIGSCCLTSWFLQLLASSPLVWHVQHLDLIYETPEGFVRAWNYERTAHWPMRTFCSEVLASGPRVREGCENPWEGAERGQWTLESLLDLPRRGYEAGRPVLVDHLHSPRCPSALSLAGVIWMWWGTLISACFTSGTCMLWCRLWCFWSCCLVSSLLFMGYAVIFIL